MDCNKYQIDALPFTLYFPPTGSKQNILVQDVCKADRVGIIPYAATSFAERGSSLLVKKYKLEIPKNEKWRLHGF